MAKTTKNLNEQILTISTDMATRFTDLDFVYEHDEVLANNEASMLSTVQGLPGLCILFGELDNLFPRCSWDEEGHKIAVKVINHFENHGFNSLSSFVGLAGIGFSIRSLSKHGVRYKGLYNSINDIFLNELDKYIEIVEAQVREKNGVNNYLYDNCYGLSGIGRYLITINTNRSISYLKRILKVLVDLSKDIDINGINLVGWYTPIEYHFGFPADKGFFDCGLAHGISGPLSLLSIASLRGIYVEGQHATIEKIGKWLISKKFEDEHGLHFPNYVSFNDEKESTEKKYVTRDAWCYGSPGVCRALRVSGNALNNNDFIKVSNKVYQDIMKRDLIIQKNISPTYCHGISGLLHITNVMSKENRSKELLDYQHTLVLKIIKSFSSHYPFGFKDIEINNGEKVYLNKIGLLEGAIGVILTLLSYKNRSSTNWENLMLLN